MASQRSGETDDLESRIAAHERGEICGYTSSRRPIVFAFAEEFATREGARERERQVKGWTRRKKEALIRGDWESLVEYAGSGHSERPSTGSG